MSYYSKLLLLVLLCLPVMAQATPLPQDTIPFRLTAHNNLAIRAILNQTDTLEFMLHTAANAVTVTSAAIARLQSVSWDEETDVNSWGGSSSAKFSHSNSLTIGSMRWDSLPIWETQRSGPGTEGKFGLHLFEGKVVEMNYDQRLIILRDELPADLSQYDKLPLREEEGSLFMEGTSSIGGQTYPNRFLLHTGYGGTILYDDQFVADSKIGEQVKIIGEKTLKDSYGNAIVTKRGALPRFAIGTTDFTNLPIGFFEGAIGRQKMSVLGGDMLRRFNIIIDAARENIYLQPNAAKALAYTEF